MTTIRIIREVEIDNRWKDKGFLDALQLEIAVLRKELRRLRALVEKP